MRSLGGMSALASLVLVAALLGDAAPREAVGGAPAPAGLDLGRTSFAAAVAMPTHLAATAAVLAFACSGEVIGASCGETIEGDAGARTATWLLLATLPPLASGAVFWALGDDEKAPASLPWTLAGGAAGQLLGFGLAVATDSPAVAVLSVTAFPVAGELVGLLATRASPRAPAHLPPPPVALALPPQLPGAAPREAWLLPLATGPL